MGTKAVFAIAASDSTHFTRIVGMTHDGTVHNLKVFARACFRLARQKRVLTAFKRRDFAAISKVQDALVTESNGWLFIDNVKNAEWVSHSAILDPKTGRLEVYWGKFEEKDEMVENILAT